MNKSIDKRCKWSGKTCDGTHLFQLDALFRVAKVMATCSGQKEMLQKTLDVLEDCLEMFHGIIMLTATNNQELIIETFKHEHSISRNDMRYQVGEGISGKVLEQGVAEIIEDVSKDTRLQNRIIQRKLGSSEQTSFICVPIILGNETVGTLSVDLYFKSCEQLSESLRVLSIVASIVANDIHNRRIARLDRENLLAENRQLKETLTNQFTPENMIGNSAEMRSVYTRIQQVANVQTTVLIRGESGTGKELVASAIHYNSDRADQPFIKVNCAALSESLLESELFGHEKGAFTGALNKRIGRLEEADGGTLFLDEIGDFSPAVQVKLLRIIQEKTFERIGSNKTQKVNVRIITATNVDLEEAVKEGKFRQDLYYRINVFPIALPSLRKRRNDILVLSNFFVQKYAKEMNKEIKRVSTSAINMLVAYHWPGNVRELENSMEYAVLVCQEGVIHGRYLPPTLQVPDGDEITNVGTLKARVEVLEKDMIMEALKRCTGNISAASRELGITSRMVRYKIERYKIDYQNIFGRRRMKRKVKYD